MEDSDLMSNLDWDPSYLSTIFDVDFNDMSDLWSSSSVSDNDILHGMDLKCSPILDEFSLDDEFLYNAVEAIEHQ